MQSVPPKRCRAQSDGSRLPSHARNGPNIDRPNSSHIGIPPGPDPSAGLLGLYNGMGIAYDRLNDLPAGQYTRFPGP